MLVSMLLSSATELLGRLAFGTPYRSRSLVHYTVCVQYVRIDWLTVLYSGVYAEVMALTDNLGSTASLYVDGSKVGQINTDAPGDWYARYALRHLASLHRVN